jgi:hypothetical protein
LTFLALDLMGAFTEIGSVSVLTALDISLIEAVSESHIIRFVGVGTSNVLQRGSSERVLVVGVRI